MSDLRTFILYLLGCSHPCSLHIFWPREHIYLFFCIFCPRGLAMWFCFWIPSSDIFAWRGVDSCLVFSWETACVSSAHETHHGLLFCPPFFLVFFIHSPAHFCDEATVLTCCFNIFAPVCQFVAQCCHHNFWNSFVEMHTCLWTSVLVMVLWGHQPTWHL